MLQELLAHPTHLFWPDDLTWEAAGFFVAEAHLHHGQITDTYHLGLAVHQQGTLVSFDKRLILVLYA
ncbi:hypothetical protein [Synechococcus sp. MU1655]|uniref:hypothetical protein n=1 Tax=Synechococcus sp. MU1655 TaxID=2508355 RepID=UPI00202763F4|nr:hypothetical protein [Synechococcus sp. MU1655]